MLQLSSVACKFSK